MDKFIETYGERPDGHGGLPTMATRAQDTWDALRAAYEIGKSEARHRPLCYAGFERTEDETEIQTARLPLRA